MKNKITDTNIGGKFVGGHDNSTNISLPEDLIPRSYFYDREISEKFSRNATKYLSNVSSVIMKKSVKGTLTPDDMKDAELINKFKNMKCSDTYQKDFDQAANYFSNLNTILTNDEIITNDSNYIEGIFTIIKKLYAIYLDKQNNGDKIHSAILSSLIGNEETPEMLMAGDVLIFYTIHQCGIFNETK